MMPAHVPSRPTPITETAVDGILFAIGSINRDYVQRRFNLSDEEADEIWADIEAGKTWAESVKRLLVLQREVMKEPGRFNI
jgi:hypothetical protein